MNKVKYFLLYLFLFFQVKIIHSQQYTPTNGLKSSSYSKIAIKNANIFIKNGELIKNSTILIEGERIIKLGENISIPNEFLVIDFSGKYILPAFIELNASIGLNKPEYLNKNYPNVESENQYYWNEAIHPEIDASKYVINDKSIFDEYLKMGFGLINNHLNDGIARGNSCLIKTFSEANDDFLVKNKISSFFSFNKGSSHNNYPSSLMGSIALLRQAFYDALFYSKSQKSNINISLEELNNQLNNKLFFVCEDKFDILRAKKIADEFSLNFNYISSGNEYEVIKDLKKNKIQNLVLPLTFPDNYEVSDPYIAKDISLKDLKHWELAPYNFNFLSKEKFTIALSSFNLKSKEFWSNIHKLLKTGVEQEKIIEALTLTPAKLLGIEQDFGSIEEGKKAYFCVYDSNPFEKELTPSETWCDGKRKIHQNNLSIDIRGNYNLNIENKLYKLNITGDDKLNPVSKIILLTEKDSIHINIKHKSKKDLKNIKKFVDTINFESKLLFSGDDVIIQIYQDTEKTNTFYTLHGKYMTKFSIIEGDGFDYKGKWIKWTAVKIHENKTEDIENKHETQDGNIGAIWYPNIAYGKLNKPIQQKILIENTNVWTCEKDGIIENANVYIENGKIAKISKEKIPMKADIVIDGKGKHLSPGIVDEHSHIAISKGVNEGSQAITSEVRISDVINPEDINIYRQLSGGVTTSQLLHGSANPIGGQSAIIKLKWGFSPDEMLMQNATKFIKFALGENVKQSNWGDHNRHRFPQTRMGVEQVMIDAFTRAKQYQLDKKNKTQDFRIDLELEALSEILDKKRFITCHSYIQSEINMLMHVADSFGFKINTFTHVLEGYKVADKIKKHGSGVSTFSDWWAYKFEVNDAIPQNVVLLTKMGLICAINSDDAEMGRRLNQEAAKSIKYGNLSEQEALKLVTINPAKLLHLDDRIGSIKVGKDADLVLWSANPLSIKAIVDYTIIDGIIFYNSKDNEFLENQNQVEKMRIIEKMLKQNQKGIKTIPYIKKRKGTFHCNTIGEKDSIEENTH